MSCRGDQSEEAP